MWKIKCGLTDPIRWSKWWTVARVHSLWLTKIVFSDRRHIFGYVTYYKTVSYKFRCHFLMRTTATARNVTALLLTTSQCSIGPLTRVNTHRIVVGVRYDKLRYQSMEATSIWDTTASRPRWFNVPDIQAPNWNGCVHGAFVCLLGIIQTGIRAHWHINDPHISVCITLSDDYTPGFHSNFQDHAISFAMNTSDTETWRSTAQ
jgi:hypothetical protein